MAARGRLGFLESDYPCFLSIVARQIIRYRKHAYYCHAIFREIQETDQLCFGNETACVEISDVTYTITER